MNSRTATLTKAHTLRSCTLAIFFKAFISLSSSLVRNTAVEVVIVLTLLLLWWFLFPPAYLVTGGVVDHEAKLTVQKVEITEPTVSESETLSSKQQRQRGHQRIANAPSLYFYSPNKASTAPSPARSSPIFSSSHSLCVGVTLLCFFNRLRRG